MPDSRAGAPAVRRRVARPGSVLAVASLGGFLAFLDATIVNVAIPSIREAFPAAGLDGVSWVLNAYNIVFAAFLVAAGRIADLVGRKRVFEWGVILFTTASVLCALAPSLGVLIAARVLQAAGAAVVVPSSLGLVMAAFPGREQARGIALWTAGAALAAGVGPATGGALIEVADWRWCFLVNLPIGAATWWLSGRKLVESRAPGRRSMPDLGGALVLAGSIAALTLGIVKAPDWGWTDARVLATWAASAALLVVFVRRCARHRAPIVDLNLMRIRSFGVANAVTVAGAAGFYGYILCNVLFLTLVWGYDALHAGLALTPGPFVAAAVAGPLGRIATRVDARVLIIPGAAIWALGVVYMVAAVGPRPEFVSQWLPGMAILGLGAGITFPAMAGAAAAAAPGGAHATATALNSVARQLGAVLGVALLVAIIGSPSPDELPQAFDSAWLFCAACLGSAGLGAAALGRLRPAAEPALGDGPVPSDVAQRTLTGLSPGEAAAALTARRGAATRDRSPAAFLADVPMFAGMDQRRLEELSAAARTRRLLAGKTLFEQGDTADSMFVIRAGRMDVIRDGRTVGVLGPGDVIGELALVTGGTRAATARARRDCDLAELSQEQFTALLEEPGFARALVRVMGEQLQQRRSLDIARPPRPTLLGVVGASADAQPAPLAAGLRGELGRWGRVALVTDPDRPESELAAYAEGIERDHDHVILLADDRAAPTWRDFCLRHADRVLAVVGADGPPGRPPGGLEGADLVFTGPAGSDSDAWLAAVAPRTTYRCRPGDADAVARMARRLGGRSVGIVLSGGGARGLAHLGVLEELEAAGVVIDRVAGTSMGSFIGAMYASGMSLEEIDARCYEEWVRRRPLADYRVPRTSIIRGVRVREMLFRTFSGPIELLQRPFFCVSTDLLTGELYVHRTGSLGLAVGASMNIPGLAPPLSMQGRLLVDGGLRNNLPVDVMAVDHEGPVIASDVGGAATMELVRDEMRRRRRHVPDALTNSEEDLDVLLPSLPELLARIVTLSSADGSALAARHAQLTIRPDHGDIGLFEFHMLDEMRAAGREAVRRALAAASAGGEKDPGEPEAAAA